MSTVRTTGAAAPAAAAGPQVPRGRAGWWHDYVCQVHGTELVFDPRGEHRCPHGCRPVGDAYDGAWRVLQHQACARTLRASAHRYERTGEQGARAEAAGLLADYVRVYDEILAAGWNDTAQGWMLQGKLFQQALTEAIWGVAVADGIVALVRGDRRHGRGSADLTAAAGLLSGLVGTLRSARHTLVEERGELRNNYTAWLDAAGALAARAQHSLGVTPGDDRWLDGDAGLYAHLDAAVGGDGWEWEGSTYYHVFVLRAALIALADQDPRALPASVATTLTAMLRVLVELSTDQGGVPALHDGPYGRVPAHQELLEVAVLGRQLVDLPGLARLEDNARRTLPAGSTVLEDQLEGWFSGPPLSLPAGAEPRPSVHWPDVGHLVLRPPSGRWQAVVDAGPHGGSHGHHDKLALYLYGRHEQWQPAPGVPPYASPLRLQHYARTQAHPTVRVDGLDQAPCTGRLERWEVEERGVTAVVSAHDAYPGVAWERHLQMSDDYLLDVAHVRSEEEHDVVLGLRPAGALDASLQRDQWHTTWTSGDGTGVRLAGLHVASAPSTFALTPGRGPSDDPSRVVSTVDWSATCQEIWFVSVYQPQDETHRPTSVRIADVTAAGITVEVVLANGRTAVHDVASASTPASPPASPTSPRPPSSEEEDHQ